MGSLIDAPGVYTMDEATYHGDPCRTPSLSSGIAKTLLEYSPLHAWTSHPRLNPDYVAEERAEFDRGSGAHALLLEGQDRMCVVVADNWRTKAAQEKRDAARAAGFYPVLETVYNDICKMRDVALAKLAQCSDLSGLTLADGKAEQAIFWQDGGVWIRIRPDWLSTDRRVMLDYKTTKASANPLDWVRTMAGMGGEVQGSLYRRGNAATGGPTDTKWVFLVQECDPPYACSLVGLDPAFIALGDDKVERAIGIWRRCLAQNEWPAYPDRICWVEPPVYHTIRWEERRGTEGIPYDVAKLHDRAAVAGAYHELPE